MKDGRAGGWASAPSGAAPARFCSRIRAQDGGTAGRLSSRRHSRTNPSVEPTSARIAWARRPYPTVVDSREPMLPPHRDPATWVGNTCT